jgi:hypothetical protein
MRHVIARIISRKKLIDAAPPSMPLLLTAILRKGELGDLRPS